MQVIRACGAQHTTSDSCWSFVLVIFQMHLCFLIQDMAGQAMIPKLEAKTIAKDLVCIVDMMFGVLIHD